MNFTIRALSGLRDGSWGYPVTRGDAVSQAGRLHHNGSKRAAPLLAKMAFVTLLTVATTSIATTPGDDPPRTESGASAAEFTLAGEVPADWFERLAAMPNVRKLTVCRPDLKHFKVGRLDELQQLTSFRAEDFPLESPLADAVAIKLAKLPGLQSLTVDRTGLTDRGLAWLQDSSITELVVKEEEFLTDDAFEHVAKMKCLRTLVLDATPIEVAGLAHLQHCPQLRRLALRRHPAGSTEHGADGRLAAIAGMDKLEELEIESTAYTRLVVFKQIKSLKQLTLRRCGADSGCRAYRYVARRISGVVRGWQRHFAERKAKAVEPGLDRIHV